VLDTNTLLDIYRFTEDARADYLRALGLLGDRLWIPHQTAQEFFERRTTVIRSRHTNREAFDRELETAFDEVAEVVLEYARRRGIAGAQAIADLASEPHGDIQSKLDEVDAGPNAAPLCRS
jgi:hypothetical protein